MKCIPFIHNGVYHTLYGYTVDIILYDREILLTCKNSPWHKHKQNINKGADQ